MTNPNNAIGTNGAYPGRTSVNALNDNLSAYTQGVMSGWACVPDSGLTVSLGGSGTVRDVAIAQDNAGNKTTINNISASPVNMTIPAAPVSNSRIDAIIAYVDNPPVGTATETDNPAACGLIVVSGTAAATPLPPAENTIRTAITTDGASGATAYYVVLAYITIENGTTSLTASNIENGPKAILQYEHIDKSALGGNYSTTEQDTGYTWIDGSQIYKKTVVLGTLPNTTYKDIPHNISNLKHVIHFEGYAYSSGTTNSIPLPFTSNDPNDCIYVTATSTNIVIGTGSDRSYITTAYMTLYYIKN